MRSFILKQLDSYRFPNERNFRQIEAISNLSKYRPAIISEDSHILCIHTHERSFASFAGCVKNIFRLLCLFQVALAPHHTVLWVVYKSDVLFHRLWIFLAATCTLPLEAQCTKTQSPHPSEAREIEESHWWLHDKSVFELSSPSTWEYSLATSRASHRLPKVSSDRRSSIDFKTRSHWVTSYSQERGTNFLPSRLSRHAFSCIIALLQCSRSWHSAASVNDFVYLQSVAMSIWFPFPQEVVGCLWRYDRQIRAHSFWALSLKSFWDLNVS